MDYLRPIAVYDGINMKRLAYLQNAYNIAYNKRANALWTASFSMPQSDPKTIHCQAFNLVEIWDIDRGGSDRYVGLFRIMPHNEETIGVDRNVQYTLEHVMATLLDDVMIGWHEVGNTGTYTAQVLSYVFDQQTQKRWILEKCDYTHEYLYGWQDENLLSAIYSVVTPFSENDFYWSFDTQVYPWRISLEKTKPIPKTDIRYKKNMTGIRRNVDPSNLTTRLYCYGFGDGDNKLTIRSVNNDIPYIESINTDKYGIISQIWTDERITVEETLKATGEAMLKKLENPLITYDIDVQTIHNAANLNIGDTVRVVHSTLDEYMIVQELSKDDVSGKPYSGKIILGDGTNDFGNSIADITERQKISETYSQGSESIFMDSFYDNADNANPMETTFTIPENAVHVNEIRFSAKLTNFRAYSKATLGGGALTQSSNSGGATTQTSSSGGGATQTTNAGGNITQTSDSGGGGAPTTTTHQGQIYPTTETQISFPGFDSHTHYNFEAPGFTEYGGGLTSFSLGWHSHTINWPSHGHTVYLPNHVHNVTLPSHTHTVVIPTHTHQLSIPAHTHDITLPNHTHNIEYGIYKGPIASQMSIYLDNVLIGTYASSISNLNLISHMNKNANGDVMRGDHKIKIVPSSLTRIECAFQIRLFTNARGSGQY